MDTDRSSSILKDNEIDATTTKGSISEEEEDGDKETQSVDLESSDLFEEYRESFVKLCHASLGDFSRSQATVTSLIGTTTNQAHLLSVLSCFSIFSKIQGHPRHFLYKYGLDSWYHHLTMIDKSLLGTSEKELMCQQLYQFYTMGEAISYICYCHPNSLGVIPFIYDRGLYLTILKWIRYPDVLESSHGSFKFWMESVSSGPVEILYKPLIDRCAQFVLVSDALENNIRPAIILVSRYMNEVLLLSSTSLWFLKFIEEQFYLTFSIDL